MYEDNFGTDWESLSHDELVERAFALGITEGLDEEVPGELDRLLAETDTAYSKNTVELAYSEGKNRGRNREVSGGDSESAVEDEAEEILREVSVDDNPTIPDAVSRIGLLDRPTDGLDRIRLPELLTRE